MSHDIDLFTDGPYGSLDFTALDKFLRKTFKYVSDLAPGPVGMGVSYLVGHSKDESVQTQIDFAFAQVLCVRRDRVYRIRKIALLSSRWDHHTALSP